ncbi:Tyrosine-protein kinase wzc [Novipirellula aureliae]|uniref:Tyrosine-protein kinase wzc n=1 Tax=Novipirellula aureliae TaxID=2527966 RepID=A0A5C6DZU9_9BACT|nr:polysaccharide biosynthesis tyrosine autokinase [Novipirellula aureliae]TWU41307.1 Tyrosine-protein kinase wzc [Novipirellula aureliae]
MISSPEDRGVIPSPPTIVSGHRGTVIAAQSGSEFQPLDLLHAIRRRGWMGFLIGLPLSVALAVGVFMTQKPVFRASALLQLSATENNLVFDRRDIDDFEIFQGTQKELVRSRMVLTAALRDPRLSTSSVIRDQDRPVDWMLRNLSVSIPPQTEIMNVSIVAPQNADPVNLVNATVEAYMVEVVNRERDSRQRRLDGIERVLEEKQAEIRRKRNELKSLAEQLGTGDSETLSIRQQFLVQELGSFRRQLIELQSRHWSLDSEEKSLQMAIENAKANVAAAEATSAGVATDETSETYVVSSDEIESALLNDSVYLSLLRDKLTTLRLDAEAESAFKTKHDSPYERVNERIEEELVARRQMIKEELGALEPLRRREQSRLDLVAKNRRLLEVKAELEVLADLEERIAVQEQTLREEFEKVGNKSIDVEMMRSEIQQLDAVMANVAQQREELKVELRSRPRVEVLRNAEDLEPAEFTKRVGLAGVSGIAALALPLVSLVLLDLSKQRVNSSALLTSRTGLDIIGTLPVIPPTVIRNLRNPRNKRSLYWQATLTESIKRIANRLVNRYQNESGQHLALVTSANRGEGKTTLASQLARNIASMGRTVILVDLDLRHPVAHRLYSVDLSPGVCEVLRGEQDLKASIQPTSIDGLSVLPAGECCRNSLQALGRNKAVPMFFRELASMADVVIIDGCPVLTSADVSYVAPHVDTIVFSVHRDISRVRDIKHAVDLIRASGTPVAGAVVIERATVSHDVSNLH